jgi:hypothetical protein
MSAIVDEAKHIFSTEKNLSTTERALSIVGGLVLAAAAAQPRPNKLLSLAALVAGSMLAIRGATGHCAAKAALNAGESQGALRD